MRVSIWLKLNSAPIIREDAMAAYEKGSFYVIQLNNVTFEKYPISDIWRVSEATSSATDTWRAAK